MQEFSLDKSRVLVDFKYHSGSHLCLSDYDTDGDTIELPDTWLNKSFQEGEIKGLLCEPVISASGNVTIKLGRHISLLGNIDYFLHNILNYGYDKGSSCSMNLFLPHKLDVMLTDGKLINIPVGFANEDSKYIFNFRSIMYIKNLSPTANTVGTMGHRLRHSKDFMLLK